MNEPVSMKIGNLARLAARIFDRNLDGYVLRTSEIRINGYMMDKCPVSHKSPGGVQDDEGDCLRTRQPPDG